MEPWFEIYEEGDEYLVDVLALELQLIPAVLETVGLCEFGEVVSESMVAADMTPTLNEGSFT